MSKSSKPIDIYFHENYAKLYERIENGKTEYFHYKSSFGEVNYLFLIREIPIKINGETYYDIVTPYGYGGPVVTSSQTGMKERLISEFNKSFSNFCKQRKVVSEFIRFHPLINNAKDFESVYDVLKIRKTLGTNLKNFDEPVMSEFSRSCRKNIRRALNKGVTYEITENPNEIGGFKQIYYSTMKRNNATDFYYFDDTYFNKLLSYFPNNILIVKAKYEGKTIAQGLYFIYGKYIHIHLSGTLNEYLKLSPAYILRYAVTLWGKENGYHMIHHGGGRTNSEEDGLYKFKKNFAENTEFDFYVGKKIWNESIYTKLCEIRNIPRQIDYFPRYRYST